MEDVIKQGKEMVAKAVQGGKETIGKVEDFMKEHKILSGVLIGAAIYLLLKKKKSVNQ